MDFTEFRRRLGAEPLSDDPELMQARESSPEFEQEARDARQFEEKLVHALRLPEPDGLIEELQSLPLSSDARTGPSRWMRMALAASLLLAVGAAGITWNMNRGWDSVEAYVADHYRHDGYSLLEQAHSATASDVQKMLAALDMEAAPALAGIVGVIKYCRTPDGRGVHMVLDTQSGPVTVIFMPETTVIDRETLQFDNVEAMLVQLQSGSAAIIAPEQQQIADIYSMVQRSILPAG
jgi:hypothetical protein